MHFSFDELEIIKMFYTDLATHAKLISYLKIILTFIDEPELTETVKSTISKLETMTAEEFSNIMNEIIN